ncbi:MAG: uroporphyrinogen decarboxylase [Ignavibacteria bacterium]|nr:MAG: uroporphyrinogen decarboxylase [Ignavibacteria bacterium]KAF0160867.1 MAG: uroporphyrinogen decarboxylase [Ignavibacteria bacterium]
MTDQHWELLQRVIKGEVVNPMPTGFIIDCPWLPNWYGVNIIDYFSNDQIWIDSNLKAINDFPDTMFLPGFWSEFGMCTEPSAFGARCTFPPNEFPHAHKIIHSWDDIDNLPEPNPKTDGLLPFMLNRLKLAQPKIEAAGHKIRFSVSRGPLNVASYLMGTTEFLTMLMMEPDKAELLVRKITAYLKNWHELQMETFPTIDGMLMLDDIIGFMGEDEFRQFGLPYFQELYGLNTSVKFLHNDAPCRVSAPLLPEMGVNLFNMGFEVTLNDLKELTQNKVTMLGNLPPRDVLAAAAPEEVYKATTELVGSLKDRTRIIMSCGGGMPPAVSTENISAFLNAVKNG